MNRSIVNPFALFHDFLVFPLISICLVAVLRQEKFDLVFTKGLLANFYGSLASSLARIPCLWDMQEIVSKKRFFGLFSWILNGWARFFASSLIVPAEAIRDQFQTSVKRKTFLVPNGIDTNQFRPGLDSSPVRKEWGIKPDQILVGHIARFTYWKGQLDFVKAAREVVKQIPNARFVLVGSPVFENDVYEKEVKRLTKELGLNGQVLFPGFRDDLESVMAALDIFVHSSIEPEGCPITLITAMAMAKPVVATRVAGNSEIIVSEGQGILVEPSKPSDLAQAILLLFRDPQWARSLGENARRRVTERYSLHAYAKGCEKIFEEIGVSRIA